MPNADDESLITNLDQDFAIPVPFTSTTGNIVAVEYNVGTETLFVTFKDGKYAYFDVPRLTAFGFHGASSATLYLNDQIKGVFSYEQID